MYRFDLVQLSVTVLGLLPKLSEREQVISLGLYRLLAEGLPVSRQQLASALNLPVDVIKETLAQWLGVYYDGEERVTGYWGLALPKMAHRFLIGGKTLYAWCAWDTLFIPELLGQTVRVESNCPKTSRKIQLTVAPQGVSDLDPLGAVMSLLTPGSRQGSRECGGEFLSLRAFLPLVQSRRELDFGAPGNVPPFHCGRL
jgi:alkylmercury lyase